MFTDDVRDIVARITIGALFALLCVNILVEFLRTGHVTGLLLLTSESLVVVLTVLRRPARTVDRSALAAVTTVLSVAGPPLLRPINVPPFAPDALTAFVSATGLAIVIVGKMMLGRSFGLVPANRGVVARGPYNIVRHPIYAGYLVIHVGFLAAHPAPLNMAIMLVADTALVVRALLEERVLGTDREYQAYCQRVGWHLVPGVF